MKCSNCFSLQQKITFFGGDILKKHFSLDSVHSSGLIQNNSISLGMIFSSILMHNISCIIFCRNLCKCSVISQMKTQSGVHATGVSN